MTGVNDMSRGLTGMNDFFFIEKSDGILTWGMSDWNDDEGCLGGRGGGV